MDFDLTDEHRLLEQSVREWAGREVAPRIRELDRTHTFDRRLLPQMASLGLLGISVPEQYGGSGMDYLSLGLACEELEYVDTSLRVILSVHVGLNSLTLLSWGTEDQKARSTMKALMPDGSFCFFFSRSVQPNTRKLSATSASEIHIFSPVTT